MRRTCSKDLNQFAKPLSVLSSTGKSGADASRAVSSPIPARHAATSTSTLELPASVCEAHCSLWRGVAVRPACMLRFCETCLVYCSIIPTKCLGLYLVLFTAMLARKLGLARACMVALRVHVALPLPVAACGFRSPCTVAAWPERTQSCRQWHVRYCHECTKTPRICSRLLTSQPVQAQV